MIIDDEESEPDDDANVRAQVVQIIDRVDHEEENLPSVSAQSSKSFSSDVYNDISPRVSTSLKCVLVESETSPEPVASHLSSPALTAASSVIKVEFCFTTVFSSMFVSFVTYWRALSSRC